MAWKPEGPLAWLLLTLLCALLYVPGTAAFPPLDRDEARFAQATKQMLETGDFVGIYFQDEPRNKKPIGIHWLQAASVSVFSDVADREIWAYRIPSVVGAWLAVLLAYAVGRKLFDSGTAFLGAALLAASVVLVGEAQNAKTDAFLLATIVAAQLALARAYLAHRNAPEAARPAVPISVAVLFWAALGVSTLVKGPVGPGVVALTVLALGLIERRWRWLGALRPLPGVLLWALIVAPWLIAVSVVTDTGFVTAAVQEDFFPKLIGGQESHGAPPGYFLLTMLIAFWPASLLVLPAVVEAWRRRHETAVRFCLAWLIPSWILFELVPTKLPHYAMPTYPALALLVATTVIAAGARLGAFGSWWAKAWYGLWAAIGLALAGAMLWVPFRFADAFGWWVFPSVLAVGFAAALGLRFAWTGRVLRAAVAVVACAVVWAAWTAEAFAPNLDRLWGAREVRAALEADSDRGWRLASAGFHEPSLVFLAGTDTRLVDAATAASFLREPGDGRPHYVLVADRYEEAFLDALGEEATRARVVAKIDAFNYSRGRELVLRLYTVGSGG